MPPKACGVPAVATEQLPQRFRWYGRDSGCKLDKVAEKTRFSCGECGGIFESLREKGVRKLLVVGIETHVCVGQTVMDLMTAGFDVYVAVDAIGARHPVDHRVGIRRMEMAGATLTTTEAAMFEWCEDSKSPAFKTISQLVQQTPPEDGGR